MKPVLSAVLILAVICSCADDRSSDPVVPSADPPTPTGGSVSQSKYEVIAYKYHADTQILNLRLSGGYYRFSAVPQATCDAFVAAGAGSKAYLDLIDGKFKAEYIREDPAWMRSGQPNDAGL